MNNNLQNYDIIVLHYPGFMGTYVSVPYGGYKGCVCQRQVFVQALGKENSVVCEEGGLKKC